MTTPSMVTTHVLDTGRGEPASGITVRLERADPAVGPAPAELGRGRTDADGRITRLGPAELSPGNYRLVFETADYLSGLNPAAPAFFPEIAVTFAVDGTRSHYHVPLLLSPYSYSTYRGS